MLALALILAGTSDIKGQNAAAAVQLAGNSPTEGLGTQESNVTGAPLAATEAEDRVLTPVDSRQRVVLSGHMPVWAKAENDVGPVPPDLPLDHLMLLLARSPEQQQAFEQFLKAQQDRSSPDYHHWLTSAEIGERWGVSPHDIAAVTNWLESQGLHVNVVSKSRTRIDFGGTASAVATAFGMAIRYYQVNGEKRFSIAGEPHIPAALVPVTRCIYGLSTVKYYSAGSGPVRSSWYPPP